MKITILGRGNAGCISALHFYHYTKIQKKNIEIELIHDSKIDPVPVGQATTLDLANFIWRSINYKKLLNFNFVEKRGILYENWGKKNKKWYHEFPLGSYGLHFNPNEFQDLIINNLKINFKETDKNILNYDEIDSDFIIDCRGAPKDNKNYKTLINPLNCSLLASLPIDKDLVWTRTIATPDGWCFYIPLKDRVSVGYNFNKEITSIKEAENNFKKILPVKNINKVFNFNQYVAKKTILDKRVFLNGNKLFFLEPLEATAMNVYQSWCRLIWDCIIDKRKTYLDIEIEIKKYIYQIQNFILWHYSFGSIYKSKFWKFSKKLYEKNKDNELQTLIKIVKKNNEINLKNYNNYLIYGMWTGWNIQNWYEGMENESK
jgi:hypothetical protein